MQKESDPRALEAGKEYSISNWQLQNESVARLFPSEINIINMKIGLLFSSGLFIFDS